LTFLSSRQKSRVYSFLSSRQLKGHDLRINLDALTASYSKLGFTYENPNGKDNPYLFSADEDAGWAIENVQVFLHKCTLILFPFSFLFFHFRFILSPTQPKN